MRRGDEIEEGKLQEAVPPTGRWRRHVQLWSENVRRTDHLKDLGVCGRWYRNGL